MRRALEEVIIEGVDTNADFMHLLTFHKDFIKGTYNTGFWAENHKAVEAWVQEGMKIDGN